MRYDVDGVHEELGILLEVEAGRGARGNAVYRDLVRTSLIVDATYLALGVVTEYHHKSGGKPIVVRGYQDAKDQLDTIYASQRFATTLRRSPYVRLLIIRLAELRIGKGCAELGLQMGHIEGQNPPNLALAKALPRRGFLSFKPKVASSNLVAHSSDCRNRPTRTSGSPLSFARSLDEVSTSV